MTDHIHFIITGGTIDKSYDPATEKPEPSKESVIPGYIENVIKPHFKSTYETICMLDSVDMTMPIRKEIFEAVKNTETNRVIITHGTSAMIETLDYLNENLEEDHGKTIILVGAMIPMKEIVMNDAGFNLGYAIAQVKNLEPGVYICMHGDTFMPGDVCKVTSLAQFKRMYFAHDAESKEDAASN